MYQTADRMLIGATTTVNGMAVTVEVDERLAHLSLSLERFEKIGQAM